MEKKVYYGMVWDNYMGRGYVEPVELTEDEYRNYDFRTGKYWSLHETEVEAQRSLDYHYMD